MRRDDETGGDDRESTPGWTARREGPSGKLIAVGVIAVLLLFFVLQNRDRANIDFLFWDGDVPLWNLILVSAALGLGAGWFLGRSSGKRRAMRERR